MIVDEEVYLQHFGVKGMHWGVRNEERGARKQARQEHKQAVREGKAQKYDAKADMLQTKISEIDIQRSKTKSYQSLKRARLNSKKVELQAERKQALEDADAKRKGKLTKKQKKVLIGASAVAAVIAADVAYHEINSGEARRKLVKGKNFIHGEKGALPWKMKPELSRKDMDADEIMHTIVPKINRGFGEPGSTVNCRRCTFAYEMRRRGHDVAATRTTTGSGQNAAGLLNTLSPGQAELPTGRVGIARKVMSEAQKHGRGEIDNTPIANAMKKLSLGAKDIEPDSIFRSIAEHPDGARGELGLIWEPGGGHSMAWEMVKGKPTVFDTQTGKKYESMKDLEEIGIGIQRASLTRLDNADLNTDFLLRWLKSA